MGTRRTGPLGASGYASIVASNPTVQRTKAAARAEHRRQVVAEALAGTTTITELARRLQMDRSTIYDWIAKAQREGWDLTNAPPTEVAAEIAEAHRGKISSPEQAPDPIAFDMLTDQARAALADFGKFRADYLGRRSAPWAVEAAHMLLDLYHSPEEEYLVLNVAPGAGKSTLVTHDFVVWAATLERAKGEEPTISLGHKTLPKARWYLGRVGSTFSRNLDLLADFGRFRPNTRASWSTDELQVEPLRWYDLVEKEPTFSAAGYDASVLSGRYKLIVWDDLVDKGNSSTVEQREKLVNWWDQEAESRLNTGGLIVLSGARYGPEDLFYSCVSQIDLEDEDEDGAPRRLYERVVYPAHFDELHPDSGECAGPWPDGCLLDPERISAKKVRRYRSKDEGRFNLIWQQADVDPAGFLADPVWFTGGTDSHGREVPGCLDHDRMFGDPVGFTPLTAASIVSVDPAPQNYWAIQHWLVPSQERTQILFRAVRAQLQAPQLLYRENDGRYTGKLEEFWQLGADVGLPFTWLVVETNTANRWLLQYPFVAEWAMHRGVTILRHETHTNKADPERGVQMLGPLMRDGDVRLPYAGYEEKIYVDHYIREARTWPEGTTSDQIMAHWFVNSNLTSLMAIHDSDLDEDRYDLSAPAWAGGGTPAWARQRLGVG